MQKILLFLFSVSLIFCWTVWGGEERKELNLSRILVQKKLIPNNWMLAHVPYGSPENLMARNDLNTSIKDRETKYANDWIRKVVNPKICSGEIFHDIYFVSGVGEHKDDAAIMKWSMEGRDYEIIDSRFITFLINKVEVYDIENVYKRFVNQIASHPEWVKVKIYNVKVINKSESYGMISVDYADPTGVRKYFLNPIEWYRNNDFILFVFDKVVHPSVTKGAPAMRFSLGSFGGTSADDPRPYLRFENSNREILAKEYYEKIKNQLEDKVEHNYEDQYEINGELKIFGEPRYLNK